MIAEAPHGCVLLSGLHRTMQQAQAQVGEDLAAQTLIFDGGSFDRQRFGFLDQWTDNKGLVTFRDLVSYQCVGFSATSAGAPASDNLLATRWKLVNNRDIQVS